MYLILIEEYTMDKKAILIADDEWGFRSPLIIFLKNLNHEVIEASNKKDVLENISKADILIIDVLFPFHREGIHVVKEIRDYSDEKIRNIPVIFYSILNEDACTTELKGIDKKSYCWLQKPFELTVLRKVISERIR